MTDYTSPHVFEAALMEHDFITVKRCMKAGQHLSQQATANEEGESIFLRSVLSSRMFEACLALGKEYINVDDVDFYGKNCPSPRQVHNHSG